MRKACFSAWLPGASRSALAAVLLAVPVAAIAGNGGGVGGFSGTPTLFHGSANIVQSGGVQTISIPTTSPVTTINWVPTDMAIGGGAINFLPAGNTVNYVGAAGATVPYTVLNRILANDPTRSIGFYGAVNSTANTRVWFYSPGGLLIGTTAQFNVGGLVLTTADPAKDGNNNFMPVMDHFSVQGTAGGTSAITIAPGATIKALNSGQSNYIVAIAPQINQGGTISVAGSVALVAAESATFAVDSQGLFNIMVSAGTTVSSDPVVTANPADALVNTGSIGGPNTAVATGSSQRVYMVAVPKNNAITMAISSGGSIGFAVADAANVDGDQIVLSAGNNIADSGTGNPVVPGRAGGTGAAKLTVGAGSYTSNTYAAATDSALVTDPAASIGFASGLAVIAPQAEVNAQFGTISVGGDLAVNAANALTGIGGAAMLQASGGSIAVTGNALVTAEGSYGGGTQNPGNVNTQGGTALVSVTSGALTVGGTLYANAIADGTGANAALAPTANPYFDSGASGFGGTASVTVSGASASLTATGGVAARSAAISSEDQYGNGGFASGGTALIEAGAGGSISVGINGAIVAAANAASGTVQAQNEENGSYGGSSTGGTAQVIANAGTIRVAGVQGISALANATGGNSVGYSGSGGDATGGTALIAAQGSDGSFITNTNHLNTQGAFFTAVEANASGGSAAGFQYSGGTAKGGSATLQVTGPGQSTTIDHGNLVQIAAQAVGGSGAGNGGGSATGGSAQLLANGGAIAITNASLKINAGAIGGADNFANGGAATGGMVQLAASNAGSVSAAVPTSLIAAAAAGSGSGNGGNATGGIVQLMTSDGGTVTTDPSISISASATGGSDTSYYSGSGGNALGGNIFITLGHNAVNFDSASGSPLVDASYTAGTTAYQAGPLATAASAGGVLVTDLDTLTLGGALTLAGNTQFYAQAGGSITVPGSITGSGAGAYLHLWSDDLGTGSGTVTLANGALNLPGNAIDIYYNPASLGMPTDYSAGIMAGNATAYQLADNIDQLQQVGSYVSQNFALGKNIDASATQGWNGGAGFVPIGTLTARFTGQFDGLNHTITNLYINNLNLVGVGLFGSAGTKSGASTTIRNVGLVSAQVTGFVGVGALVGASEDAFSNPVNLVVANSWSTGSVTGGGTVGGLVGLMVSGPAGALQNVHSDATVTIGSGGSFAGGLAGHLKLTAVTNAFATGSVTAGGGDGNIGGLVGLLDSGSLNQVYAAGAVQTGSNDFNVGGLVGQSTGSTVAKAYAVGNVTARAGTSDVGGLIGRSDGAVAESWASGAVAGPGGTNVGGFVGENAGTISNSYWDSFSTGQANGVGGGTGTVTQLNEVTSDPNGNVSNAFYSSSYANFGQNDWVYDDFSTRPIGAWEVPVAQFGVAPIVSAHQVQLIDYNLGGNYTITQNIDMRGTAGTDDIWGPGGFLPLGHLNLDPPFTGTLEGAGHVLSNLTMVTAYGLSGTGLIQENDGTISDLGLANVNITASNTNYTGAIAADNLGIITDSFATGTITLTQYAGQYGVAGGLVGLNSGSGGVSLQGTVTRSYATVAVSGGAAAGGLVGDNEGLIGESYANGAVNSTLAGGLVGETLNETGPTVTNSYWDTQLTGQSLGCGSAFSGTCSGASGLTTAQTLQSASFTGFSIDTTGGQGLPWRQYQGQTTPLLEAFLTPIIVQAQDLTTPYNAQVPNVGANAIGAEPALTFGTAQVAGATRNAGSVPVNYAGGLYSTQLGYDFVPSTVPGTLVITPAALTLSASSDSRVYNATTSSSGVVSMSGLYGSDSVAGATQSFTSPNVMGTNGSTLVVNNGYLVNDGNGGGNYTVSLQSAPGTITPAMLAVTYTANPATSTYGTTPSGLSGTVGAQGLQGSDTLAAVTSGTASFTTPATAQSPVGSYAINGSGLAGNSGNYSFSFGQAPGNATALTINRANMTVDVLADAETRSYGSANPPLTYTDTGLANGDMLTGSLATTATINSNVSVYAITQGTLSAGNNYTLNFTGANLTVTPASVMVTYAANPLTSIYGNAPGGLSGSVGATGLVLGQTLASVTSGQAAFTTTANATSSVGSYAVIGSGVSGNSANYNFSFAQAPSNMTALTIAARGLTLTADALSRVYGGANPAFDTATAAPATATTGLVNGDAVSGETVTSPATAASGVGQYALNGSAAQFSSGMAANYVLTYAANPTGLAITPASATITYMANPISSIYGNTPSGLTGSESASGLVNGDTLGSVTSGTASFTTAATARSNVGSYAVTGAGLASDTGNYTLSFVQAAGNATALTIDPASLAVLANAQSRSYGAANPALTYSETGLVNGDMLSGSLATSATTGSGVGSYAITQGGLSAGSNYVLNYTGANLAITPASATITYIANPISSIYGNTPSGLTGSESASGLVNGDTLGSVTSGTASFTTAATARSNVGSYAVTGAGLASDTGNYTLSFVQAAGNATALTIAARALTLAADPLSRVYGGSNPAFDTATAAPMTATSGLVNGDAVSGEAVASLASAASGVGQYALNGSAARFSAGLSSNYAVTYAANPTGLTITPAALTLLYTAAPAASTYGTAPAGLTGGIALTGLVNGDSAGAVTSGSAVWTSPATAASGVGSYAIDGSGIVLASANYSLTSLQAAANATALTINPAALTILYSANPASRSYGSANPPLSGVETASGLVNGDTLGTVTSGAAAFATPATAASNVGSYAVDGAGLAGISRNYSYSFVQAAGNAAALTVTPAPVTISYGANPASSIYGDVPNGLSGSASAAGLVNGDTLGGITTGAASFTTAANGQSPIGSYAVTGSGLAGSSGNYSFSFAQAPGNATALTITPRAITVTADPQQRQVGAANPVFTYVMTPGSAKETLGLVNGDQLTGQLTTSATITSPAGTYDILQGSLAASANYRLSYVGNILTINYGTGPIVTIGNLIEANLVQQSDASPEERRRQQEAELAGLYAGLGLYPPSIAQSLINDQLVTTPPPVNEPVSSNGNASLWGRGAP